MSTARPRTPYYQPPEINCLRELPKKVEGRTIAFVACASTKQDKAVPAQDLYTSRLFKAARQYAELHADEWYILSSKHGMVLPDMVLEPYEDSVLKRTADRKVTWHIMTYGDIIGRIQPTAKDLLVFLAGKSYYDGMLQALNWTGATLCLPLRGMGIGQQYKWLQDHNTGREKSAYCCKQTQNKLLSGVLTHNH